ncbi:hypothetical protein N7493_006036 [Penicillium malachiteum]|uniref:Uncharacterized protein n=1 Tax=Penicillium malachiteum TaxID=1324776 RepID=A0AAD6HM76_9EURO|nr:hypothetical protein N7493_006036 [Penicillium malachiteum]
MPEIPCTVCPEVPVFLKTCVSYYHYLARGQIDLVHPSYKKNSDGEIIVTHGEVFCRVHDCKNGRSPLISTSTLRGHLQAHGHVVEQAKNGRLNKAEQNAVMQWFEHLMESYESKKNGHGHDHDHEKKCEVEEQEDSEDTNEEDSDSEEPASEQEDEEEAEDGYQCY